MTMQQVIDRVLAVRAMAGDPEAAHAHEDQLHQEVLRAIAGGQCDEPAACARLALATRIIDFPRWCA